MTSGHKHRIVRLRQEGVLLHLLQTPLLRTGDEVRADKSPWVWGQSYERLSGDGPVRFANVYVLTPLSILHTLTGLTVETH